MIFSLKNYIFYGLNVSKLIKLIDLHIFEVVIFYNFNIIRFVKFVHVHTFTQLIMF